MEWRKGCSCITKDDCTDVCYKCCRSSCLCKGNSMIAWVWLRDPREFAGCFPVEVTAVYDHTTDCSTMTTDEFCCRMYHDVSTVFDRANQVWCCKSRVYDKRNVMFVCNFCNFLDVDQVGVRVSKSFNEDCFCVFLDCSFKRTFYFRIYECSGNAVGLWKGMC